jgi:transcriptional regulator with XRE-family HTH domain
MTEVPPLTPERIRTIRLELGLSQEDAGALLGGGPRAFQKYESGEVSPSAALEQLLQLLVQSPHLRERVLGTKGDTQRTTLPAGLAVSENNIVELVPAQLQFVLDLLIRAEMNGRNLERVWTHVSAQINAPDGGEDGRVAWADGPPSTRYFPARVTLFQNKATSLSSAKCVQELLSGKTIKPRIAKVLTGGGAYVLVVSRAMAQKDLDARLDAMRRKVADLGSVEQATRVHLYSATQIATWVNEYPAVALAIREMRGDPTPFRSFDNWKAAAVHRNLYVPDLRIGEFASRLESLLVRPNGIARVVGPSGIGKSRLAIEVLSSDTGPWRALRSKLLFVDLQGTEHDGLLREAVQRLVDERVDALLVVENCLAETHNRLMALVGRTDVRLRLLTLDMDAEDTASDDLIKLEPMSPESIEDMTKEYAPHINESDRKRMVEYSDGYPLMVRLLGDRLAKDSNFAWKKRPDIARIVALGRDSDDRTALNVASIVALFGLVRIDGDEGRELVLLHEQYGAPPPDDFRRYVKLLLEHGSLQRRGGLVLVTPRPVALDLARERWLEWSPERVAKAVTQLQSKRGRAALLRQLSRLDKDPTIQNMVRRLVAIDGVFDTDTTLLDAAKAEALSAFSEIAPAETLDLLVRQFGVLGTQRLQEVEGAARRSLVHALSKLAFRESTFVEAAWLMLMLAEAENETWGNNATGCFKGLFPLLLADTAAGLAPREKVLDRAIASNTSPRLGLAVSALASALETRHFSRTMGSETQGAGLTMEPWRPTTHGERDAYYRTFLAKLTDLATRSDEIGHRARGKLGPVLFGLVSIGLIEDVERSVTQVQAVHADTWLAAIDSLQHLLRHPASALPEDIADRVRNLIAGLQPKDLKNELFLVVSQPPWDWAIEQDGEAMSPRDLMTRKATDLAHRIVLEDLWPLLPNLLQGEQRQGYTFGYELAKKHDAKSLIQRAMVAMREVTKDLNIVLLSGILAAVAQDQPADADAAIAKVAADPKFLWMVPALLDAVGVTTHRVPMLVELAKSKAVEAHRFRQFGMGRALDKLSPAEVSPLLIALFENGGDYWPIAVDLLGMYVYQRRDVLDQLHDVLRVVYATVGRLRLDDQNRTMSAHHFTEITNWLLSKCEGSEMARFAAIKLAEALRDQAAGDDKEGINDLITGTLRPLFKFFGAAVWPIVGAAAVGDSMSAMRLRFAIRGFEGHGNLSPTILELPETLLLTWCKANPSTGPAFLASVLPALEPSAGQGDEPTWHPLVRKLIDEFGSEKSLRHAIDASLYTFSWSGSLTTYFSRYVRPFDELKDHPIDAVRLWAQMSRSGMEAAIDRETTRDSEQDAIWKA